VGGSRGRSECYLSVKNVTQGEFNVRDAKNMIYSIIYSMIMQYSIIFILNTHTHTRHTYIKDQSATKSARVDHAAICYNQPSLVSKPPVVLCSDRKDENTINTYPYPGMGTHSGINSGTVAGYPIKKNIYGAVQV
jgi:hypothetical protein